MPREVMPEDAYLWRELAQEVEPLAHRQLAKPVNVGKPRVQQQGGLPPSVAMPKVIAPPLTLGAYAGVDRRMAQRFRGGEMEIDGTLDLHGMHREQAHRAVIGFVQAHYVRGSRCVLAITGKGRKGFEAEGVLRELLPLWLAEPGLRPMVLACDVAQAKHGGMGAYYILIRRKR